MGAFFIFLSEIRDADAYRAYGAKAAPTIAAFGGAVLQRGAIAEAAAGEMKAGAAAVIGFADLDAARAWYASDAYQALIPLRDKAIEATILLCEAPPA